MYGGILKTLNLATKLCKKKHGAARETFFSNQVQK